MPKSTPSILIVDDEADMVETCRKILVRRGYAVETALSIDTADRLLEGRRFDLLITDVVMPGRDGLALARGARRRDPQMAVLVITAHATIETAVRATQEGACDYIPKPFTLEQLELAVERALEMRRLREENAALAGQLEARFDFANIMGVSPAIRQTLDLVRKVADTEASILIRGESGTGKELLARCIHVNSRRRRQHFVPIDCAALPEALLESELFGAERGAYTGADVGRAGLLEAADGGTLLLDEVGNLPLSIQIKLLRVLQERAFRRLGSVREIPVNVRVVAATNQDLERLTREHLFREDLYYRLKVVEITLPPLRERPGDIMLLAQRWVEEFAADNGKDVRGVSVAAMMLLERYEWPGNVRELRNLIERAVLLTESNQIMPGDLPPHLAASQRSPTAAGEFRAAKRITVAQFEVGYLRALLESTNGNVSQAADRAGLKRTALHRLLARYGLDAGEFRSLRSPGARGEPSSG